MYTTNQISADSKRSLQEYRMRKLFETVWMKVFIVATLPIYMLFRAKHKSEIAILLTSGTVLTAQAMA